MTSVLTGMLILSSAAAPGSDPAHGAFSGEWVISLPGDTVRGAGLDSVWLSLSDDEQAVFMNGRGVLGRFARAYARKMLFQMELEARGLLSGPGLESLRDSWFRYQTGGRIIAALRYQEENKLTEDDFGFFTDRLGRIVWYTVSPGTSGERSFGPVHLPEISPLDLALHIDSLEAGRTLEGPDGVPVRLDSLQLPDMATIEQVLSDSAYCRGMAVLKLSQSRLGHRLALLRAGLDSALSVSIDTAAVERLAEYYRGAGEPVGEVVMTSRLGSWTSDMLRSEIDFLAGRTFTQPDSTAWQLYLLDNLLVTAALIDSVSEADPGFADSMAAEAARFMIDTASDMLYDEMISSRISLTEEDLEYEYSSLAEPETIPEKRVLRLALMPPESLASYQRALDSGDERAFISSLPGVGGFSAGTEDPQATMPLAADEVPWGLGEPAFSLDPAVGRVFLGPLQIDSSGTSVFLSVDSVMPPRIAGIDDIRTRLEYSARSRLEEEAFLDWMEELAGIYGLEINEEALSRMQAEDPFWMEQEPEGGGEASEN